jgi:hypothetical protein
MKRTYIGGCAGYIYPATRYARPVGGCAGWVEA